MHTGGATALLKVSKEVPRHGASLTARPHSGPVRRVPANESPEPQEVWSQWDPGTSRPSQGPPGSDPLGACVPALMNEVRGERLRGDFLVVDGTGNDGKEPLGQEIRRALDFHAIGQVLAQRGAIFAIRRLAADLRARIGRSR